VADQDVQAAGTAIEQGNTKAEAASSDISSFNDRQG
jgi:hypothetical protein